MSARWSMFAAGVSAAGCVNAGLHGQPGFVLALLACVIVNLAYGLRR